MKNSRKYCIATCSLMTAAITTAIGGTALRNDNRPEAMLVLGISSIFGIGSALSCLSYAIYKNHHNRSRIENSSDTSEQRNVDYTEDDESNITPEPSIRARYTRPIRLTVIVEPIGNQGLPLQNTP